MWSSNHPPQKRHNAMNDEAGDAFLILSRGRRRRVPSGEAEKKAKQRSVQGPRTDSDCNKFHEAIERELIRMNFLN